MNNQVPSLIFALCLLTLGIFLAFLLSESSDEVRLTELPETQKERPLKPRRETKPQVEEAGPTPAPSDVESNERLPEGGKKSISGTVIDAKGRSVAKATIRVHLVPDKNASPESKESAPTLKSVHTTTSRPDGTFNFPPLSKADNYWITVLGPNKKQAGQLRLPEYRDLTLITIRIYGGFTLRGVLVDSSKNPLANLSVGVADVELWDPKKPRELANGDMRTVTDKDGKFVIHGLQRGSVFVRVYGEGWMNNSQIPITIDADSDTAIVIEATKGLAIEGMVLSVERKPIFGAQIVIKPESGGWRENRFGGSTITDKNGRFLVGGLSHGSYIVYAQARGVYPSTSGGAGGTYVRKSTRQVKKGITAGPGLLEFIFGN